MTDVCSMVKPFYRRHKILLASHEIAQSQRRISFPFRSLHMRVFRKNFIVPHLGGPNALATPPPPSIFHSVPPPLPLVSFAREQKEENEKEETTSSGLRSFGGPHAHAWQRILSTPSDLYAPSWKTWDELETKESLSKHTFVCFLFLFSLSITIEADIPAIAFWFQKKDKSRYLDFYIILEIYISYIYKYIKYLNSYT